MDKSEALDLIIENLQPALNKIAESGWTVRDFDIVICPVPPPTPPPPPKQNVSDGASYTGYSCLACQSTRMQWRGSCQLCLDCGETTSCG